jgi:hypothetical protein
MTLKIETLSRNYDKAYEIYFKCFIDDVYELYNSAYTDYPSQYAKLSKLTKSGLRLSKGNTLLTLKDMILMRRLRKRYLDRK